MNIAPSLRNITLLPPERLTVTVSESQHTGSMTRTLYQSSR